MQLLIALAENPGRKLKYSTEALEHSEQPSDPPEGNGDIRESQV